MQPLRPNEVLRSHGSPTALGAVHFEDKKGQVFGAAHEPG
jgi:hypothetical protein